MPQPPACATILERMANQLLAFGVTCSPAHLVLPRSHKATTIIYSAAIGYRLSAIGYWLLAIGSQRLAL